LPSTFGYDEGHNSNGDIENGSNKIKLPINKEIEIISNPILGKDFNNEGEKNILRFSNLAGLLLRTDKIPFEKMIFRVTRGNCYMRFSLLNQTAVGADNKFIDKMCFIIFYKSDSLGNKIRKICDGFQANM
jgi:V-type H+-transporting ATPase subunit a